MRWLIVMLKTLIIVISFFYFLFLLYSHFSPQGLRLKNNVKNSLKISEGMPKLKVLEIMGDPDHIYLSSYNSDSIYFYNPPFFSSDGIEIGFDKNEKVSSVVLAQ